MRLCSGVSFAMKFALYCWFAPRRDVAVRLEQQFRSFCPTGLIRSAGMTLPWNGASRVLIVDDRLVRAVARARGRQARLRKVARPLEVGRIVRRGRSPLGRASCVNSCDPKKNTFFSDVRLSITLRDDDRPADREAADVHAVERLGLVPDGCGCSRSSSRRRGARCTSPSRLNCVRARLGDEIDEAAVAAAILRREPVGDDLHFGRPRRCSG